ncbi:MAG: hypothetical protein KC931_27475, partial [Candidatus Omnitrophica bacterium]|nr:hypothetical protein [Candidatus Omnitrophota bacterium]
MQRATMSLVLQVPSGISDAGLQLEAWVDDVLGRAADTGSLLHESILLGIVLLVGLGVWWALRLFLIKVLYPL